MVRLTRSAWALVEGVDPVLRRIKGMFGAFSVGKMPDGSTCRHVSTTSDSGKSEFFGLGPGSDIADEGAVRYPIDATSQQETSSDAALSGPAGQSVLSAYEGQPVEFFIRQTAESEPEPTLFRCATLVLH